MLAGTAAALISICALVSIAFPADVAIALVQPWACGYAFGVVWIAVIVAFDARICGILARVACVSITLAVPSVGASLVTRTAVHTRAADTFVDVELTIPHAILPASSIPGTGNFALRCVLWDDGVVPVACATCKAGIASTFVLIDANAGVIGGVCASTMHARIALTLGNI